MMHIEQEIFELNENVLEIRTWNDEEQQVFAGFSTRKGGVSTDAFDSCNLSYTVGDTPEHVLTNRQQLAAKTPVPFANWIFTEQKHTANIREVTQADCGRGALSFEDGIYNTDGLYTYEKNIMLATFHADCTPVYFRSPKHNLIGIVHAGWQGTVKEITTTFLRTWFKLGVKPRDIEIVIGPSASAAAYQVGEDVVAEVLKMELEDARDALIHLSNGQYKLDTGYLNYLQAVALKIPEENIIMTSYCTICDADLFYSYRRDGKTGRMLAFISQK